MNLPFVIHVGDSNKILRTLPDQSVSTIITSPPYFGLRDYGNQEQIGLEATPEEYIDRLVLLFRQAYRVLRDDGTLWLNLGDSYARTGGTDRCASASAQVGNTRNSIRNRGDRTQRADSIGLKQKDLIGIPWRVAFALQANGWYLRQDIIWHKPNPMPESVTDRCTKSHEYIFLLSKSPRYYFDAEAIKEPLAEASLKRLGQPNLANQKGSATPSKGNGPMKAVRFGGTKYGDNAAAESRTKSGKEWKGSAMRNRRSVWTITTKPFKGAHFATFPIDLIEPCILAGCPKGGVVLDPFAGAGTTGLAAMKHNRRSVLCELNPEYAAMALTRLLEAL